MDFAVGVGLESTLDILITFPDSESFEELAHSYQGDLSPYLERGYKTVSRGSGGEEPIDGMEKEAEDLLESAKEMGAEISYSLGGNSSQEAVTLANLGVETIFLGSLFPDLLSKLNPKDRGKLENTDTRFAKRFEQYSPSSYILQAPGTNRYILTEGKGRRIDQLRSHLKELPDIVGEISDSYSNFEALSLVGWHVIFGMGLSKEDLQLTSRVIRKIREENDILLFTDAGGMEAFNRTDKKRLCELYSLFDIVSVNEDEVMQIIQVLDSDHREEIDSMRDILDCGESSSTVWLHTPNYQVSLSSAFSRKTLEEAQTVAALVGLYKAENGGYPSIEDLFKLRRSREFSEAGLEKVEAIKDQYGKNFGGYELASSPCFNLEKFFSTIGTGDVSAGAYLYSLLETTLSNDKG
ncbi:hypothetical protein AKJ41_00320 [candidate division MSBL1 archaeon SCGC-AAA259O05]|uniref:Carbohydrate kinase PfkB domain-containing protein n=1 Tax=candidate division MSBL1 archaeon SCGC-AAA259O05 TaxID=1698271 RepID=A0A133V5Q7_9EURY|nr:hypothetical protein AKJ41_00320 [candidate division MSBL1 archaeon SCGC-AAA259O05]